jgi:uncharacterized protein YcnI
MRTTLRRLGVVLAPAAALLLVAPPAGAHVTVSSPDAAAGGYGKLVFRVPNESDTASTTKLQVTLPADTPFAGVRTMDVPGWTAEVTIEKLDEPVAVGDLNLTEVPRTVTWTAQRGQGIGPDEFAEFPLSVGPFVDDPAATYEFAATQTYDDGEVVAWDQSSDGGAEPELPAPTLSLDGSGGGHGTDTAAGTEPVADTEQASATADADEGAADTTARVLGGAGLLLGLVALGLAVTGRRRTTGA